MKGKVFSLKVNGEIGVSCVVMPMINHIATAEHPRWK